MSTQEIPSQADFRERAKTNDVPIARLIGFEARDIADGRATVVLAAGPQHANPMGTLHGGILCDIAGSNWRTFPLRWKPSGSITASTHSRNSLNQPSRANGPEGDSFPSALHSAIDSWIAR